MYRMSKRPPFQKALITGGAGFIGSHLSEALLSQGVEVAVVDNLSTGRKENIERLLSHPGFHFYQDSVLNTLLLDQLMSPDVVVFHLASAVGVQKIVNETIESIETMILGTEAVLKTASRHGCKVLLASTSEVYGKTERIPFRENDDVVFGPSTKSRWSYAASKMIDEFLALAYYRERNLPVVIFRLFNTVGPRQTGQYGMVIPNFVDKALKGEPLKVHGDGEQTRCFCNVDDAIKGILDLAAEPKAVGEIFNIGSTERVTINELARQVLSLVARKTGVAGKGIELTPYSAAYNEGFEDIRHREPDASKIKKLTGWEASTLLEETLLQIIGEKTSRKSTPSLRGKSGSLPASPRTPEARSAIPSY